MKGLGLWPSDMVVCPTCGEQVAHALLRVDYPRCSKGHELGVWVACGNPEERHVYLKQGNSSCPYCGSPGYTKIEAGTPVKCMHRTEDGRWCIYPEYTWMVDGPPCHLNHLDKIVVASNNP